jgi:adenylate cyclase
VNVAVRLEGLAEPGGVCVSTRVQEDVAGRLDLTFRDIAEQNLRTLPARCGFTECGSPPPRIRYPLRLLRPQPPLLPEKALIAVLSFQNMSGDPDQEYFADGTVEEITRMRPACQKF